METTKTATFAQNCAIELDEQRAVEAGELAT